MQADLLPSPSTLLYPNWYGGPPEEMPLPAPAYNYKLEHYTRRNEETGHEDPRTKVTLISSGLVVYNGIGPAAFAA